MRNKRKSISLLGWIIGALLLIYLGVFCYLNLCKYAQHVDSDIAAEALLAREIWVEKDITPNDWISSTERRIIGMPTVAAVFYGITGSMQTAAGITCVLLGAILLGIFYFFLRKLSLSRPASITALLVLCALPINGFRNEGQMVPFVALLLFLFAEYYVFHGIFLFFNIHSIACSTSSFLPFPSPSSTFRAINPHPGAIPLIRPLDAVPSPPIMPHTWVPWELSS